ncbi:MAG: CARDB domain-containing protein, partial [Deltaproteobacteria bacterium]
MLARTWSLLVIVLLFFVACLTTPDFGYTGSSTTQKHDLRIALVISDELRNMTHEASMYTDCWWQEDQRSKNDKANLSANFDIGGPAEQLLIKGLTSLFTKVDVYKQSNDIRSKTEYDYIMIPRITIDTSYDKEAALNRWKRTNNSWLDYENAKIIIEAKATYVIKVIDPTANQVVGNIEAFYQDTNYEAKSFFGINVPPNCSPRLRHKSNNSLEKNYKKPIEVAMNKAFEDLIQKADAGIRPLALAKSQERALPSSLSLAIAFSDKDSFSPNNLLDAGETAQINVAVKNDGKGSGYNTVIKLSSDNPKVTFDKEISLGDVAPGETKNIKVNVKAALDLTDGTVPFTITCSEKRGYDCKRYNLNVSSAHFEKPGLMIAGYKINDSNTGLGQGNGNGIPENGEIIEIIPLVKNTGTGPALGVTLSIASISDGIEIKNKNVTIPQILPGQTVSGNLSFFIPSTFSGKSIEVTFNAVDTRGVSGSKAFALNTAINQPSLTYAYRIIDQKGNTRSDMQNGESGEIEIRPSNKGQLDAKNVSINLSSDTFSFSKSQDEIMRIGAQSEYTPIRFPFQVPRVTDKQSVNVAVKLTQKDFPGLTDTINVPLRLARPDLKVTHQVIGALQQGQAADLIVRVENIGQLDADEVVLSLDITKKGVLLHGNRQVTLGKIEAGRSS